MITVPDRPVQIGQPFFGFCHVVNYSLYPTNRPFCIHPESFPFSDVDFAGDRHDYRPHRSAGVLTGASHRAVSSGFSGSTDSEKPRMSQLVT